MSTTTHILFNSPALHSLKRDQLVQLCKHHSLKANGKNTELIDRLKQKATELTELGQLPEEALDENERDETGASIRSHLSRPSEQWEMVMDDIEEVDEPMGTMSSMGTLRSNGTAGEFGTAGSKCEFYRTLATHATGRVLTTCGFSFGCFVSEGHRKLTRPSQAGRSGQINRRFHQLRTRRTHHRRRG